MKTMKTMKTKKQVMKDKSKKTPVKKQRTFFAPHKIKGRKGLHSFHGLHALKISS